MKKIILGMMVGLIALSLTACPGKGGPPIKTTITVEGTIRDVFGEVVKGIDVRITGKKATTTDSSGKFKVLDVPIPYEIAVVNKVDKVATVYQGLNRSDPVITIFTRSSTTNQGRVQGKLSGGGGYPESGQSRVAFGAPNILSLNDINTVVANKTTGAYEAVQIAWFGNKTIDLKAYALQWKLSAEGLPSKYTGYGKISSISLLDGKTLTNQNIVMNAIKGASFNGSIGLSSGYKLRDNILYVDFGDNALLPILQNKPKGKALSFDYVTPAIKEATITFVTRAEKDGSVTTVIRKDLPVNSNGMAISIPAAAEPSSPADKVTGVDTTTSFSWSGFENGVHRINFAGTTAESPQYYVYTKATSTTIPDLSDMGLGLPKDTRYFWSVMGLSPFANIDELITVSQLKFFSQKISGETSNSINREFMTAP